MNQGGAWIVCAGWDVGGWMGRKHGAAAVAWNRTTGEIQWMGRPGVFGLVGRLALHEFVGQAAGGGDLALLGAGTRLVVAIDAPLGYPTDFQRLVAGDAVPLSRPDREIDNRFAYRETERHVRSTLGRKALSAPFDKLGNNATVAISHARRWSEENGLRIAPFQEVSGGDSVIIEVYPALEKSREGRACQAIADLIPEGVELGTDAYDAAICAVLALAYAADGMVEGLPRLCGPQTDDPVIEEEGWIYYLARDVRGIRA